MVTRVRTFGRHGHDDDQFCYRAHFVELAQRYTERYTEQGFALR